jgi:DNA-binding IclR family transcriptional regulator
MTLNAEVRSRPNVQSVDRAVRILTMLAGNPFPIGVAELASRLQLSTTSVHRMLTTLSALGWVEQNTRTSRYRLGTRFLSAGAAGLITHPLVQHGRHFLERLSEITGFDAFLSTLVAGRVVYLAKSDGENGLGNAFEPGVSLPAHSMATGKLLLAYTTREARDELYKVGLEPYAKETITDPEELEAELATILTQGYALDRGERFDYSRAMAVPVLGSDKRPLIGMSCVGPAEHMQLTDDYVAWLSQVMESLAMEMADHLTILGDLPKVNLEMARYNLQ